MPYQPVAIPYRGLNIDSGYSALPPGFTSSCLNVLPYDAFKGKLRIGQRRPLLAAIECNDTSPLAIREIQNIVRADAYVSGTLTQRSIIVAGGEVFILDAGNSNPIKCSRGAGIGLMAQTGHIGAAVFGQFCYFCDGTHYRKVDITSSGTPAVVDWTAAQGPYNHVRTGSNPNFKYATLLCRFGARLALAGLVDAPNTWFLSKLNDPDNWTPAAASNTNEAVAGASSTRFGAPGEPIVSLMPVGESGLMLGCRRSLVYLTADPVLTDARMIEMSRTVGVVSTRAWTTADSQSLYVMSQDGLYRIQPNEFQVTQAGRISGNRLDSFFQNQAITNLNCCLGYDAESQNVYVVLSRLDIAEASRHLVYNQPTDSFWVWQTGWSDFRAPTCCGEFPTGASRGSLLAFGSDTGYVGWFDKQLTSGVDGQAATGFKGLGINLTAADAVTNKIVSNLMLGPVTSEALTEVMLRDVRVELTMDETTEDPDFAGKLTGPFIDVLSGQTAEEAIGENILSVRVTYSPDFPAVTVDAGTAPVFTPDHTYDGGTHNQNWNTTTDRALDLFYEQTIGEFSYLTTDTLIQDPALRTYANNKHRIYNSGTTASPIWQVQHTRGTPVTLMLRDDTAANTSVDTPGGTYLYHSPEKAGGFALPDGIVSPQVIVSSGTYSNTNAAQLAELDIGRNDAIRCRIRDQAIYLRLRSLGVPWALERMSVLVDAVSHTNNVKGTY